MLIFDSEDRLHLPLTTFAREAARRLSASSVRLYLYAALPFFTFLDRTRPGVELRTPWNAEPQRIQAAVAEYLEEQLGCAVRRHRLGFELVTVTGRTRANVGAFLAAVKLFYTVMRELGCYASENPARAIVHRERGYFSTNVARMRYPCFRQQQLPIGSGAVEASAKYLVQQRTKRAGSRWSDLGARAILDLRCHLLSGRSFDCVA